MRENLVLNPSPAPPALWSRVNSATVSYDGGRLRVAAVPGTRDSGVTLWNSPVEAGETITVAVDVTGITTGGWTIDVQAGGDRYRLDPVVVAAGGTQRLVLTFTARRSATHAIYVLRADAAESEQAYLGRALIERGATDGAYFDGSTPSTPDRWYAWTGTPNASTSIAADFLTLTPQLDTGTVRLEVNAPPADTPSDVLNMSGGSLLYDAENRWGGDIESVSLYGALVGIYCTASNQRVTRALSLLDVGARYRVQLAVQRTNISTVFGVLGKVTGTIPAGSGVWTHTVEFTATSDEHQMFLDVYENNLPFISRVHVVRLPDDYDLADFTLTRTDVNGVRPVRLLDGQEIIDGTLVVEDAEAALLGTITYSLTSATGAVTSASTTLEGATGYRLAPAVFPQYAATAGLVTGFIGDRPSATTVHDVIGRADPVVRLAALGTRRGSMTFWCADYAQLVALLDVYRRGEVVLLRQPDHAGLDLYHVATDTTEQPYDAEGRRWRLDVEYVEVSYPVGPLLGSSTWTWDDVAATYPTWDAVMAAYPTWNALQIGPLQ